MAETDLGVQTAGFARPVSVSEASAMLGVSEKTIRRWIKSGAMKAEQKGKKCVILIPMSEMSKYVQTCPLKTG
jgi:excisionase family DNA binding protein